MFTICLREGFFGYFNLYCFWFEVHIRTDKLLDLLKSKLVSDDMAAEDWHYSSFGKILRILLAICDTPIPAMKQITIIAIIILVDSIYCGPNNQVNISDT